MKNGVITDVKVGDILQVDYYTYEGAAVRYEEVIAVYPHMVLTVNSLGLKRGVSAGELIVMGKEKQEPKYEALRISRKCDPIVYGEGLEDK